MGFDAETAQPFTSKVFVVAWLYRLLWEGKKKKKSLVLFRKVKNWICCILSFLKVLRPQWEEKSLVLYRKVRNWICCIRSFLKVLIEFEFGVFELWEDIIMFSCTICIYIFSFCQSEISEKVTLWRLKCLHLYWKQLFFIGWWSSYRATLT